MGPLSLPARTRIPGLSTPVFSHFCPVQLLSCVEALKAEGSARDPGLHGSPATALSLRGGRPEGRKPDPKTGGHDGADLWWPIGGTAGAELLGAEGPLLALQAP